MYDLHDGMYPEKTLYGLEHFLQQLLLFFLFKVLSGDLPRMTLDQLEDAEII